MIESAMADPGMAAQLGGQRPSLLFCGDLNSGERAGLTLGALEPRKLPAGACTAQAFACCAAPGVQLHPQVLGFGLVKRHS